MSAPVPARRPKKPAILAAPKSPCLDCSQGIHTCDPIMRGLGTWFRRDQATGLGSLDTPDLEDLVRHLDEIIDGGDGEKGRY